MKTEKEEVVLSTSDEAAKFVTGISGWVSRHGRFWGKDEKMARYDGCTHNVCDCGNLIEKGYTYCEACRQKDRDDIFNHFEKVEWDGETPICIFDDDQFFFDYDGLNEWCEEHECKPQDLQLVLCKPIYASRIDDDMYCDDLPEDTMLEDVSSELASRIKELNDWIEESKIILSWQASKIAVTISESNK